MTVESIDWGRVTPEQYTGFAKPHTVNWEAVRLVIDRMDGSRLQKARIWKLHHKSIRDNGIHSMTPWWRVSYCSARLELGDFSDYWGWEFRGARNDDASANWAADLYYQRVWLKKWAGEAVGRLLVLGEQGVGDSIFFASMLPDAMKFAGEVVYECDPRLHTMLERSIPGLVCRAERPFEDRREDYSPDAFIPAGELMRAFRKKREDFPKTPYLKPDLSRVQEFEGYRGRIGLSWCGRQGRINPHGLVEQPLSVQYNESVEGIESPPIDLKNDLEGVLALVTVMERVVTVPTSVHHIAGAAGVNTQIIVPPYGSQDRPEDCNQVHWDYSTLYADGRLPWYASARVYKDIDTWRSLTT